MDKFYKNVFFVFLYLVLFALPGYGTDCGMNFQVKELTKVASDFFVNGNEQEIQNIACLTDKIQKRADEFGLNLEFGVHADIDPSLGFKLSGTCEKTGADICTVSVEKTERGSRLISAKFNPNNDGCIVNKEDGNLRVTDTLESVFVISGDTMKQGSERDFNVKGVHAYKIRMLPSLYQKADGPCGYYALFNLGKLYNSQTDINQLLNRREFEGYFAKWKAHCENRPEISNFDIKGLIESRVAGPDLCKDNVFITCCDINAGHKFSNAQVLCFGALLPFETQGGAVQDETNSIEERVKDFRQNGTPQCFILGSGPRVNHIPGLTLGWDDSNNRRSCPDEHWFSVKIEWSGIPGKSPVIMTILDSSGPQDSRFAALVHWYYYMFVHKGANYKDVDCLEKSDYQIQELDVLENAPKLKDLPDNTYPFDREVFYAKK